MLLDFRNARWLAAMLFFTSLSALEAHDVNPVRTESGLVSGIDSDVRVSIGIPYAAAPVGDLRWKEPQPPPHWNGTPPTLEGPLSGSMW